MKTLKVILIFLAGLIIVFFSIGLLFPTYEYQSTVAVNTSPEKCWAVFHDIKKMDRWLEGFESLTLKSGEPLTTGSIYEIVVTDDSHRMVMSEKILKVRTPTMISYELNNDVLKSEFSFSFEGTTSTTITSKYKITGNNILWKAILFLSKSYVTNTGQEQLKALKKVIENS